MAQRDAAGFPFGRFARALLLWLAPSLVVWILLTPLYNRFLTRATGNLVRLTERPRVTRLEPFDRHHFVVRRSDYQGPGENGALGSVRVTDTHFPVVFALAMFLAVPGATWRRRLECAGWALLVLVFFHLLSLFFWVQFIYALTLGDWSTAHYSEWGRNFYGLGKHLLDLPFKFAMPLILWSAFYLPRLLPPPAPGRP